MNQSIVKMLKKYPCRTQQEKINALKEIIQNIALLGLSYSKFFNEAAFYGGTALRICHGLDRFSEDLDFCLKISGKEFSFSKYFEAIQEQLQIFGFTATLELKNKKHITPVQSAFIKHNTYRGLISIGVETQKLHKGQKVKIKLEIDTNNPKGATTEKKLIPEPTPFMIEVLDLPSLYSGKLHAIIAREYEGRVKGRDFYDWVFYVQQQTQYNFEYLKNKLVDSGHFDSEEEVSHDSILKLLVDKVNQTNFELAKSDVRPFIGDDKSLDQWEKEYFHLLIQTLKPK